jgi:hypothetical protein
MTRAMFQVYVILREHPNVLGSDATEESRPDRRSSWLIEILPQGSFRIRCAQNQYFTISLKSERSLAVLGVRERLLHNFVKY